MARTSRTWAGGIHDSGSRSARRRSRKWRASARSVFARFFGPRSAAFSAGSATWMRYPAVDTSSATNRQPVQPSTAKSPPCDGSRVSQACRAALVAGRTCPTRTSPVSVRSRTSTGSDARQSHLRLPWDLLELLFRATTFALDAEGVPPTCHLCAPSFLGRGREVGGGQRGDQCQRGARRACRVGAGLPGSDLSQRLTRTFQ